MSDWVLSTKGNGPSIPPLPEDMYDAVCVSLVDLGTQSFEFSGEVKVARKVLITWAIANETVTLDGEPKPRIVSKEYTLSLNERANLRKDLEGWRGKPFETVDTFALSAILGKSCRLLVGVGKDGKYNRVEAVKPKKVDTSMPDGMSPVYFKLDDWDGVAAPVGIPEWVQRKIQASPEYQSKVAARQQTAPISEAEKPLVSDEDECPF
jgi:hypothetical protein